MSRLKDYTIKGTLRLVFLEDVDTYYDDCENGEEAVQNAVEEFAHINGVDPDEVSWADGPYIEEDDYGGANCKYCLDNPKGSDCDECGLEAVKQPAPQFDAEYLEEVYDEDNWDAFEDCRVRIDTDGQGAERVWGKALPGGFIGINNMPLDPAVRWQDILAPGTTEVRSADQVLHRRWKTKVWFEYEPAVTSNDIPDKPKRRHMRKKMVEALEKVGHPGFWTDGVGYCLFESGDFMSCRRILLERLYGLGVSSPLPED